MNLLQWTTQNHELFSNLSILMFFYIQSIVM